ncbi:acid protease [Terfezia boudieri ATCC MYA-4762]|uniref:Acid protease n=1 Tax=Terfezia boudieri ATCC MYA-4762 TaxID=1051890 RepID=A0A3N4LGI8_9PEZI|nr:acid protease [Terfezia boudieri ATCC MYA-4762]
MAIPLRSVVAVITLLMGFISTAQAAAPIILQQMLLSKNSTDTHAIPAIFGTPGQEINLIISTTSEQSWVYAPTFCTSLPVGPARSSCQSSIAADGAKVITSLYNPVSSSTWKQTSTMFSYEGPNNQQKFAGILGTDKLTIGGIDVPNFEFGVVTITNVGDDQVASMVGMTGLDGGIGGILGLGGNSNFLKYLVDTGTIKSSSIGVQLASKVIFDDAENVKAFPARRIVPFGTESTEFPGSIILGGYDGEKLDNEATSNQGLSSRNEIETSVTQLTSSWFEGDATDTVKTTIEYQASAAGGGSDGDNKAVGVPTVIDSTSPFILLPQTFWDSMSSNWNRGAINKTTGRTYYVDRTGFRDWRNFTFNLVSKDGTQSQVIMQHFDWNVWDPEVKFWAPAFKLQPPGVETLVLGRPAIRALYIAVDWDKKVAKTEPLKKRTAEVVTVVQVVSGARARIAMSLKTVAFWVIVAGIIGGEYF